MQNAVSQVDGGYPVYGSAHRCTPYERYFLGRQGRIPEHNGQGVRHHIVNGDHGQRG